MAAVARLAAILNNFTCTPKVCLTDIRVALPILEGWRVSLTKSGSRGPPVSAGPSLISADPSLIPADPSLSPRRRCLYYTFCRRECHEPTADGSYLATGKVADRSMRQRRSLATMGL